MDKPTKALIAGAGLGILVLAGGWLNSVRLERNLQTAQAACEAEAGAKLERENPAAAKSLKELGGHVDCDVDDILRPRRGFTSNAEMEFVGAVRAVARFSYWSVVILAVVVFAASSIPWLWYFFLRRLAEVAAAIRGRDG